jgi:hypothetical protein
LLCNVLLRAEIKKTITKESSFFLNLPDQIANITLLPTYLRCELTFNLDDYEKKEGTLWGWGGHNLEIGQSDSRMSRPAC